MILYISGLNSKRKEYIHQSLLKLDKDVEYIIFDTLESTLNIASNVLINTNAIIIAHSAGCITALQLYELYPDKIDQIHFINPGWYTDKLQFTLPDIDLKIPAVLHLGLMDEIIPLRMVVKYSENKILPIVKYDSMKHRFNKIEFNNILININKYLKDIF